MKQSVLEQYAPLVRSVASRMGAYVPSILDYEDILSYGTIGLIEALERFDASRGVKFESYAVTRIRGAIIDALRALDRLPRSVRVKARRIDEAEQELIALNGRHPSSTEVAGHLEWSPRAYHQARADSSWTTVSLDHSYGDDAEGANALPLADLDQPRLGAALEARETLDAVAHALRGLQQREFLIVSLYYRDGLTMKEIARVLDISESRVCQLHRRAIDYLRARLVGEDAA